jgi:hypothetical protein
MSEIARSPFLDTAPGRARLKRGSRLDGDEWRALKVPTGTKSCSTRGRCGRSQEEKGDPRLAESRLPEDKQEKRMRIWGATEWSNRPLALWRHPMMRRSRPFFSRARQRPSHTLDHSATICLGML